MVAVLKPTAAHRVQPPQNDPGGLYFATLLTTQDKHPNHIQKQTKARCGHAYRVGGAAAIQPNNCVAIADSETGLTYRAIICTDCHFSQY